MTTAQREAHARLLADAAQWHRIRTHVQLAPIERERRSGKQFRPHRPAPAMTVKHKRP